MKNKWAIAVTAVLFSITSFESIDSIKPSVLVFFCFLGNIERNSIFLFNIIVNEFQRVYF